MASDFDEAPVGGDGTDEGPKRRRSLLSLTQPPTPVADREQPSRVGSTLGFASGSAGIARAIAASSSSAAAAVEPADC